VVRAVCNSVSLNTQKVAARQKEGAKNSDQCDIKRKHSFLPWQSQDNRAILSFKSNAMSRLLKSWAMPEAKVSTASIFCACSVAPEDGTGLNSDFNPRNIQYNIFLPAPHIL